LKKYIEVKAHKHKPESVGKNMRNILSLYEIYPVWHCPDEVYESTDECEYEFFFHRLFLLIVLSSEDKTSKNKVDTRSPYPHTKILKIPDSYSEDSTDIVPERDEVWKRVFCERLDPYLLEATCVCCRIDGYHHEEYICIVRFEPPEYDKSDSRYKEEPIHPVDFYPLPEIESYEHREKNINSQEYE
jgi:hypothetical protein